jgi:hypothetical protein
MAEEYKIEYRGAEAYDYAEKHLKKIRVILEKWETEYKNIRTDELWVLDYPHSENQGGGEPRLRRVEKH